ncbi:hypothetical protein KCV00_g257, partial [Aureobasidium melanogenum]
MAEVEISDDEYGFGDSTQHHPLDKLRYDSEDVAVLVISYCSSPTQAAKLVIFPCRIFPRCEYKGYLSDIRSLP